MRNIDRHQSEHFFVKNGIGSIGAFPKGGIMEAPHVYETKYRLRRYPCMLPNVRLEMKHVHFEFSVSNKYSLAITHLLYFALLFETEN